MELPAECPTGAPLAEALVLDDTILEVNLTRIAAIAWAWPASRARPPCSRRDARRSALEPVPPRSDEVFPVELVPGAGCGRFAARAIRGVNPAVVTPLWNARAAAARGLRRSAPSSTSRTTSCSSSASRCTPTTCASSRAASWFARHGERDAAAARRTRRDARPVGAGHRRPRKPLGLAGIMGGEHSGIRPDTTDVLLEVAYFRPDAIAGRGRRYGLVTDASQRFERGVDPTLQERAIERATQLLLDCAGGVAGPTTVPSAPTSCRAAPRCDSGRRARGVIGAAVATGDAAHPRALGMDVQTGAEAWSVTPPPWRFDVAVEEDLIEEVARVHGFRPHHRRPIRDRRSRFPRSPRPGLRPRPRPTCSVQRGYHEAITYSFVRPGAAGSPLPRAAGVAPRQPISADLAEMRVSLWPGLVRALLDNQRRQQARVRLFELGRKFLVEAARCERCRRSRDRAGSALPEQWGTVARRWTSSTCAPTSTPCCAQAARCSAFTLVPGAHPALHPGQAARILRDGQPVGWIGRLHPEVEQRLGLT